MALQIAHLRLKEVALPGTHVSATASLAPDGDFAPDIRAFANGVYRTPLWPRLLTAVAPWAKTQGIGIRDQLEAGIRYLDLHAWHTGGEVVVSHALRGGPMATVLDDIRDFVTAAGHEKEIVLVDFKALHEFTSEAHEALVSRIVATLWDVLVAQTTTADTTLEHLWRDGRNVIVLYDDANESGRNPLLWSRDRIRVFTPNRSGLAGLEEGLKKCVAEARGAEGMRVVEAVLTPDRASIAVALEGGGANTLEEVARESNPTLVRWVRDRFADQGLNIVTADWFQTPASGPDFVSVVRSLNQPVHAASTIIPCPLGDDRFFLCYEPASGDVRICRLGEDGRLRVTGRNAPGAWPSGMHIVPVRSGGRWLFLQYHPKTGEAAVAALKAGGTGTEVTWRGAPGTFLPAMTSVPLHFGDEAHVLQYSARGNQAGVARMHRVAADGVVRTWETDRWWPDMELVAWEHEREVFVLQYGVDGQHPGSANLYRMSPAGAEWRWGIPSHAWPERLAILPLAVDGELFLFHYTADTGRAGLHQVMPGGAGTVPLWPDDEGCAGVGPTLWAPGLTIVPFTQGTDVFLLQYQRKSGAVAIDQVLPWLGGTVRTCELAAGSWRTGLDLHRVQIGGEVLVLHRKAETGEVGVERILAGGIGVTTIWR